MQTLLPWLTTKFGRRLPASSSNNPRWEFSLKSSQLKRSKGVKFGGMFSQDKKLYYQQMSYRGAMLLPFQVRNRALFGLLRLLSSSRRCRGFSASCVRRCCRRHLMKCPDSSLLGIFTAWQNYIPGTDDLLGHGPLRGRGHND